MKWTHFKTRVPAKWVLSGEHAVLRGATAIAIPHSSMGLELEFDPDFQPDFQKDRQIQVEPQSAQPLIRELLESIGESWEFGDRSFKMPVGRLKIESSIPIGAGLGSSAALCVALTRWISQPTNIGGPEQIELAKTLEHRFHGRSSGMDVAVISKGEPIAFTMEGPKIKSIGIKKLPRFTFHDTGLRARTSECVLRVEKFREEIPLVALKIDEAMGEASRYALEGLVRYDAGAEKEGLALLQKGMNQARECFYAWELMPGQAKRLEEDLLKQGALSVKMTGAGGGGMIVALWGPLSSVKSQ